MLLGARRAAVSTKRIAPLVGPRLARSLLYVWPDGCEVICARTTTCMQLRECAQLHVGTLQ